MNGQRAAAPFALRARWFPVHHVPDVYAEIQVWLSPN